MSSVKDRCVSVIIPSHDAAETIGVAVRSALDQAEVAEVIVVDDASTDATGDAARQAGQGDPRLSVLRQDRNVGPAEGRNIAIAHGTAPLIALLDSDDYYLPDRFAPLLRAGDWDLIADNIVFVPDTEPAAAVPSGIEQPRTPRTDTVDLTGFIEGNITGSTAYRGELGFLKPVISRAFLERHGLCYDPGLRLGEDFHLYAVMLSLGARFRLSSQVGYVARVRRHSLSGGHSAGDLGRLLAASETLRERAGAAAPAMDRYLRALRARYLLHDFLEVKRRDGLGSAARRAVWPPTNALPIARGVLRDKLRALTGPVDAPPPARRYLVPLD